MLAGLDYHYDNFMRHAEQMAPFYGRVAAWLKGTNLDQNETMLTDEERRILDYLQHDAIAYLNALGQFHEFAKGLRLESLLPRTCQLMPIRHNFIGHRSIDRRRKKDDSFIEQAQATAFGFGFLSTASFPVFQIPHDRGHVEFHMRNDHTVIMQEAFELLQSIHRVAD